MTGQRYTKKMLNTSNQGVPNQTHLIRFQKASIKRQEITSAGNDVEKRENLYTFGGIVNQ